ncbi:RebB family R body protein [Chryseobacterium pennipullorum]|uniref:Antirepresssor protein RebB n=1 Tax=Chryseobacterium pennipullorum TaxID=2258963 RepID=A0A3D9ASG5_9FLAO|nr:RebB family R body protein [Chryseobacterium pennipullorum]REC44185.1 antirepresssor protein RebB [Chryseobacterium pennipullorum]
MAQTVNEQITDAVTQSNVKVVGEAPAMALGNVYQSAAHSTGIMFENAVNAQNQQNILGQAATTQGIMQIYSIDTIADAISISKMLGAS